MTEDDRNIISAVVAVFVIATLVVIVAYASAAMIKDWLSDEPPAYVPVKVDTVWYSSDYGVVWCYMAEDGTHIYCQHDGKDRA